MSSIDVSTGLPVIFVRFCGLKVTKGSLLTVLEHVFICWSGDFPCSGRFEDD